jgi:hypothetical protein
MAMANVYGLIAPKRILGDVRCVVPNSLKGAINKYEVQVIRHQLRVHGRALDELFAEIAR